MCQRFLVLIFISVALANDSLGGANHYTSGLQFAGWVSRVEVPQSDSSKGETYKTLTAGELLSKIQAGTTYILIDCRPENEFRAGHIPGAVNISMDSYTFGTQTVLKSSLDRTVAQVGRKIDFVLIDSSSNEQYMPRAKFLELINILPEDRTREVILYCRKPECTRSPMAIHWALAVGYKNLWRFPGGWKEWFERKYPVSKQ